MEELLKEVKRIDKASGVLLYALKETVDEETFKKVVNRAKDIFQKAGDL